MVAVVAPATEETEPWASRRPRLSALPALPALPARPARPAAGRAATAGRGRRHGAATYRRRRIAVLGLLLAALMAAWVGIRDLVAGPGSPAMQPIAAHVVVVRPGDTVWSIALASGARGDILPLVDRLEAEVHGRPLQVGQRLVLP